MTLTELRYVVAVARERHFGRAAEKCFVSQPTLSVAVRKLEAELGITLFERGTQQIYVTAAGQPVIAQAQRILEEVRHLARLAESGSDPLSGPLRVGAIHTVGPYLFPELIPRMNQKAPRMPLVVEEGYTAELREKLRRGELDAAIIALPFRDAGVTVVPLYREPFVVLLPASHPLAAKQAIGRGALANENVLLLGPGHCFREQVVEACPGCVSNREPHYAVEGSSLETIRHMVASGLGITIVPCTAAGADKYSRRLLSVRRFAGRAPARTIALASRTGFPRSEALHALRDAVHQCNLTCVSLLEPAS